MTPPIPNRIQSALIKEGLNLARYEAGLRRDVLKLLADLGDELGASLSGAGLDTPRTDWQRARLQKLLATVERKVSEVYGQIEGLTTTELSGLVEVSADRIVTACNDAIGAKLLQPIQWTEEQIQAIVSDTLIEGAPSAEWWTRQSADFTKAFTDQMRMGMMRGETVDQLRNRILPAVDLRKVQPGSRSLIQTARRNAEALVRTSAITINNAAHQAAYDANADIMEGVEWVSTLDTRTCLSCASLDGKTWDMGESHPIPSLHWNCRCFLAPKTKSWEQLAREAGGDTRLAAELDKIPPGDRASMGGPVSGGTTFEQWFKDQDEATQREILGPKKWEIWDRSGLTLNQMVSGDGRELTLAQLKAR